MKKFLWFLLRMNFIFILIVFSMWIAWYAKEKNDSNNNLLAKLTVTLATMPTKVYHFLIHGYAFNWLVLDRETSSIKYVTKDSSYILKILIPTYDNFSTVKVDLLNINSNKLIKSWKVNKSEIKELKKDYLNNSDETAKILHPFYLDDSSIIFSDRALFKVDKNNKLKLLNNDYDFHHTIEKENDSIIWLCASKKENLLTNFKDSLFIRNLIVKFNILKRKIIYAKSIDDIFNENGLQKDYLATCCVPRDRFHLNDIEPVKFNSKYWKEGDLFLSLRNLSIILLYRPKNQRVIWLKQGPWHSQHDVDILNDNTISVFNNDVYISEKNDFSIKGYNSIVLYNFDKNLITTPYDTVLKKEKINTITEGRCDMLLNGDLYIDDANNGKLYIIDKERVKWSYIDRIDEKYIKRFTWPRIITN